MSPVWQEPHYGVFMVTGHDEALAVYNDSATFSSCNVVSGPFVRFSEPFEGDDVTDVIERHRDELPFSDQLPSFDPPRHTAHRALMMRLLTPGTAAGERGVHGAARRPALDELVEAGRCEFITDYAAPFTLLVIADLEGVPESDHGPLHRAPDPAPRRRSSTSRSSSSTSSSPPTSRTAARTPRDDIMTAMATATFPDGTTPEVNDVALLAANLFTGGQETTVRLLSFALRIIAERPDIQERLRDDRDRIPNFIEETLRYESPLRAQFRMAQGRPPRSPASTIPAGSTMLLLPGAANRDPRLFENPAEFDIDRANARYHVAFGHGVHHCAGAHLARAEGRVTINRLLDRTSNITDLRGRARPGRRPPLRVPAHLLPPGPREPRARAHPVVGPSAAAQPLLALPRLPASA